MPVPKGTRIAGRQKGTLNKATVARLERARLAEQVADEVGKAAGVPGSAAELAVRKVMEGRRLAKDELEDVVPILKSIAAKYQQVAFAKPPGEAIYDSVAWDRLHTWLELFIGTCVKLAEFQSPKFRAILVHAQAEPPQKPAEDNVVDINDQTAIARVYMRVVSGRRR